MKETSDGSSSIAAGCAWAARVSTFSLEFAALVGLGYFLDRRFDWRPWGTLVGAGIGLFVFIFGLFETAKRLEEEDRNRQNVDDETVER